MRDGEPKALRREGQPGDGRRRLERARLALAGEHMRGLAGRPGDRAVGPERDLIDPAFLVVGGEDLRARRLASVATSLPSSPPVTMRSPSDALARMPPAWMATRSSRRRAAQTAAPPRPARRPACRRRNARRRSAPPAAIGRTRSASEGMGVVVSVIASFSVIPGSGEARIRVRCILPQRSLGLRVAAHARGNDEIADSRHAALKPLADFFFRQIAADEDDRGFRVSRRRFQAR